MSWRAKRGHLNMTLVCAHCWFYGQFWDQKDRLGFEGICEVDGVVPLVHIVYGPSIGGRLKPAKGFIAIGNIAIGVIAIGGFSLGILSIAGIGLGLICFGGMAFGLLGAAGGVALGYIAVGGMAVGVYAIGGLTVGIHTIYNSPELREFLDSLFR